MEVVLRKKKHTVVQAHTNKENPQTIQPPSKETTKRINKTKVKG